MTGHAIRIAVGLAAALAGPLGCDCYGSHPQGLDRFDAGAEDSGSPHRSDGGGDAAVDGGLEEVVVIQLDPEGESPAVAMDGDGNATVAWHARAGTRARRYARATGWDEEVELDDGVRAESVELAANAAGDVFAAWHSGESEVAIRAVRFEARTGWQGVAEISPGRDPAAALDIAADGAGNAVATWWRWSPPGPFVWNGRYDSESGWGVEARADDVSSGWSRIAANTNGVFVAQWTRDTKPGGHPEHAHLWSARWDEGEWDGPRRVTSDDFVGVYWHAIGLDDAGNALAVWSVPGPLGYDVFTAMQAAGGEWSWPTHLAHSPESPEPQLVVTAAGDAFAVWSDGRQVQLAPYTSAAGWGPIATVESPEAEADVESLCDIAVDGTGRAIVVWTQPHGDAPSRVWVSRFPVGASSWGAPFALNTSTDEPALRPRVAAAPDGTALVVWQQRSDDLRSAWAAVVP